MSDAPGALADAGAEWAPWLDALRAEVEVANARIISTFTKLAEARRQAVAQAEQILEKLGRTEERREQAMAGERHRRILAAVQRGAFEELTVREQRYAAKQLGEVPPAQMQALLAACPAAGPALATACLHRWELLQRLPARAEYIRIAGRTPPAIRCLDVTGRPEELLGERGPAALAQRLRARRLAEARRELDDLGFDPAWSFTAIALAHWMTAHGQRGASFVGMWEELGLDPVSEAMLLPRSSGQNLSWFSAEPRPVWVGGSVAAQARGVIALVRAAHAASALPRGWVGFVERLLASALGDPRIPPESEGWVQARRIDPAAYQQFLEGLVREDLSVFFDHAMEDPRRKAFWLRYVRSIQRTVCILDRETYAALRARLAGAERHLSAAISRARQFITRGGREDSAQAFCLYFDRIVVVEFSGTGNAAYVYDRAFFERHFQGEIDANRCPKHSHLKRQKERLDRILHQGSSWEERATELLAEKGIAPSAPSGRR